MQILIPVVLLGLMYVMLIRPQQQRARRQRELTTSIEIGDRILTVGGLLCTVVALDDETVDVEVADGIVLTFVRAAISRKAPHPDAELNETTDDVDLDEPTVVDDDTDADNGSSGAPEVEA